MSWPLASFARPRPRPRRPASPGTSATRPPAAGARARGHAGRPGGAGAHRLRADPQRQADHRHRAHRRLRARRPGRVRRRRGGRAGLERLLRPGPVDAVADGRLGAVRPARAPGSAASGRRPASRWPLAAGLRRGGLMFGAILDFGDRGRPAAGSDARGHASSAMYFGTSLPWNLAHALGNVAFALAFGPALLRALLRFRGRFTVDLAARAPRPRRCAAASSALARPRPGRAAAPLAAARASPICATPRTPTAAGGGPGQADLDALHGLGDARPGRDGVNPARPVARRRDALAAVSAQAPRLRATGDLERTILVAARRRRVDPALRRARPRGRAAAPPPSPSGSFSGRVTSTAFGILALRAAGYTSTRPRSAGAAKWIISPAGPRRRLELLRRGGARATADDTGAVLQALAAAVRRHARAVRRGVAWLRRHQRRDGGFAAFGASNAQSTAYAVQGLVAAGHNPAPFHRHGARSPLAYLRSPDARRRAACATRAPPARPRCG